MKFQLDDFMAAEYKPRTEAVLVPDLAGFFQCDEDETPAWTVRALSADELARANEAEEKNKRSSILMDALGSASNTKAEQVNEIKEALGIYSDVHPTTTKQIEMLVMGSVDPVISHAVAAKLQKHHAGDFMVLVRKISELTAKGDELGGKSKPSGKTESSEPA